MNTPKANRLPTFKKLPPQTVSTGKKAAAETNSKWKRKNLNTCGLEEKEQLITKLVVAVTNGAKVGKEIIVGFNSVMHSIEQEQAEVICVAQDGHPAMLKCLIEAAKTKSISVVSVPKLSQSVRTELGLKSASCFALRKQCLNEESITSGTAGNESLEASIDDLKDYLLAL